MRSTYNKILIKPRLKRQDVTMKELKLNEFEKKFWKNQIQYAFMRNMLKISSFFKFEEKNLWKQRRINIEINWIACYKDDCAMHQHDKEDAKWCSKKSKSTSRQKREARQRRELETKVTTSELLRVCIEESCYAGEPSLDALTVLSGNQLTQISIWENWFNLIDLIKRASNTFDKIDKVEVRKRLYI